MASHRTARHDSTLTDSDFELEGSALMSSAEPEVTFRFVLFRSFPFLSIPPMGRVLVPHRTSRNNVRLMLVCDWHWHWHRELFSALFSATITMSSRLSQRCAPTRCFVVLFYIVRTTMTTASLRLDSSVPFSSLFFSYLLSFLLLIRVLSSQSLILSNAILALLVFSFSFSLCLLCVLTCASRRVASRS